MKRKSAEEQMARLRSHAESNGGKVISTDWEGTQARYKFECEEGHIWATSFTNAVVKKTWCQKCFLKALCRHKPVTNRLNKKEVLSALNKGKSTRNIAIEMGCSRFTMSKFVKKNLKKTWVEK